MKIAPYDASVFLRGFSILFRIKLELQNLLDSKQLPKGRFFGRME